MGNGSSEQGDYLGTLGFGIEIELVAIPHTKVGIPRKYFTRKREVKLKRWGLKKLKDAMEVEGLRVTMAQVYSTGGFIKKPQDYDCWHVTLDNSLNPRNRAKAIPMEAVSRRFVDPDKDWIKEIQSFWDAFWETFSTEADNESCGSHIHVAPFSGYSIYELKTIAYAIVIFEKHIVEILEPERRRHHYCQPNTEVSPRLREIFEDGRNRRSYEILREEINEVETKDELCELMQGNQSRNRQVVWNFRNTIEGETGTIEFRGGPQLRDSGATINWILFAVAFVQLALDEDKLNSGRSFSYVEPGTSKFDQRVNELWQLIKDKAYDRVTSAWLLPDNYENMMDEMVDSDRESTSGDDSDGPVGSRTPSSMESD